MYWVLVCCLLCALTVIRLSEIPWELSVFCCWLFVVWYVPVSRSTWDSIFAVSRRSSNLPADLANTFRYVWWFVVLLLLDVVVVWLRTLISFCIDSIDFISEAFAAFKPIVTTNDVAVSAIACEFPLDFFVGGLLVSVIVSWGWLVPSSSLRVALDLV